MERHYNAFVSYRHHPDDIKTAKEIHRSLEHYKIPKALRRKNSGPFRLFRDKEELPLSSNLSDDIKTALVNSDYLIVICSPHTKESQWVQREIDMFLQSHTRDKVLTVLSDGDPYEVIPDVLLSEEKTDPVTGEVTKVPCEPLSCDWRLPRRKAHNEELPRLAASLLGCAYDELRQRRRQYRMRRMIAVFSVALVASLCLAAYFLYTTLTIRDANARITENLNEALKNQSMHLATAAEERLSEGDRLTSAALAMAALPSQGKERPYVPEAEKVLTDALGVYTADPKTVAVGAMDIRASVVITDMWLTDSGATAYMHDQRGMLTVWDVAAMRQIGEIVADIHSSDPLLTTAEETVLLIDNTTDRTLKCFSPQGDCLWETANCHDAALLSDGHTVMVITTDARLLFLNVKDGTVLREAMTIPKDVGFLLETNKDGQPIPLTRSAEYEDSTWWYELTMLDLSSGKVTVADRKVPSVFCAAQSEDGKLFVTCDGGAGKYAGLMGEVRITEPGYDKVLCFDTVSGKQLWETKMEFFVYSGCRTLEPIPDSERLLYQQGNVFEVLDIRNGNLLSRCETGSGMIAVTVGKTGVMAVTQDGHRCEYDFEGNRCYETKIMESDLTDACIMQDGFITLPSVSHHATVYREMQGDSLWSIPTESDVYAKVQQMHGDLLACASATKTYLFDMKKQELRVYAEQGADELFFTDDGTELWALSKYERTVTVYDTATAQSAVKTIPDEHEGVPHIKQGYVYYTAESGVDMEIRRWSPQDTQPTVVAVIKQVKSATDAWTKAEVVACHGDTLWVWLNGGSVYEVNTATGTVRTVVKETTVKPSVFFANASRMTAMIVGEEVHLGRIGEEPFCVIRPDAVPGAVYYYSGEWFVLCDDGVVYSYDAAGNPVSRIELANVYNTFVNNLLSDGTVEWYVTDDRKLIVNACGFGNIIDLGSRRCCTSVDRFVAYRASEDSLICRADSALTAFERYTVDALLTVGEQQLVDFELSEAQRDAYGID